MDRKEAIEVIKKNWPDSGFTQLREALNTLVPELKESEDEKIRKEIIDYLSNELHNVKQLTPRTNEFEAWIAYLEKRKEQRPEMIQWTGKNLKEVIDFTGKSPRFDEWFKSWEEYENYVHSHNSILKLFCDNGSHYEVPVCAWIVKTPDGHNVPSVAKYIQQGLGVKIGETKIYLEDDGDEPPYTQEWLSLETTEFKIPDGAFKADDEVEVFLRKKQ